MKRSRMCVKGRREVWVILLDSSRCSELLIQSDEFSLLMEVSWCLSRS
jgi:hypothetical protein